MGPRGLFRGIYSLLLDDPDYQRLSASARLVLLTARLCKDVGLASIFRFYPEVLARQTGLPVRVVLAALAELVKGGWIEIDGPVLWIKNGLRYDPGVRIPNRKHAAGIMAALQSLPRLPIVLRFCKYYGLAYPIDTLSIGHRYPIDSYSTTESDSRADPADTPSQATIGPEFASERKDKETGYPIDSLSIAYRRRGTGTGTGTGTESESGGGTGEPSSADPIRAAGDANGLEASRSPALSSSFRINTEILEALDRCRILGSASKLRDPRWWQAEIRANNTRGVQFPAELLKAEAWIASHPTRAPRKDHARFMHAWFSRANGEA